MKVAGRRFNQKSFQGELSRHFYVAASKCTFRNGPLAFLFALQIVGVNEVVLAENPQHRHFAETTELVHSTATAYWGSSDSRIAGPVESMYFIEVSSVVYLCSHYIQRIRK